MDAKTQDAAGETGTMCVCGHEQAKHYFGDEMHTACQAQSVSSHEPCRCREYLPVQPPAAPRETALAAPTGETSDFETAVAFTIERVNAWLAGKPRNRPAAIEAFARFLVRDLYSYCDLAARVPAPSAPREPRGEASEAVRMCPVSLRSDMGPQVLTAIIEDDGDVDLRLFDEQCGGISWQACVPGTGGGRYPHTLRALRALVHAMQIDAALSTGGRDAD